MGYEQASSPANTSRLTHSARTRLLQRFHRCITSLDIIANISVWAHSIAAAGLAIRGSFTLLVLDSINRADVTRMAVSSLEHASKLSPIATSRSTLCVTQQASKCNDCGLRNCYWLVMGGGGLAGQPSTQARLLQP